MERIEHTGTVDRVSATEVTVRIVSSGACAQCRAREACGMGESQDKRVVVPTAEAASYRVGEQVQVSVSRAAGLTAVAIGYVGALVVLVAAIALGTGVAGWSEGVSAMAGIGAVVLYYIGVWLVRGRIERNIRFTITKQ